jgi:hypothetical protein
MELNIARGKQGNGFFEVTPKKRLRELQEYGKRAMDELKVCSDREQDYYLRINKIDKSKLGGYFKDIEGFEKSGVLDKLNCDTDCFLNSESKDQVESNRELARVYLLVRALYLEKKAIAKFENGISLLNALVDSGRLGLNNKIEVLSYVLIKIRIMEKLNPQFEYNPLGQLYLDELDITKFFNDCVFKPLVILRALEDLEKLCQLPVKLYDFSSDSDPTDNKMMHFEIPNTAEDSQFS